MNIEKIIPAVKYYSRRTWLVLFVFAIIPALVLLVILHAKPAIIVMFSLLSAFWACEYFRQHSSISSKKWLKWLSLAFRCAAILSATIVIVQTVMNWNA